MKQISKNIHFLTPGMIAVMIFFDEISARIILLTLLAAWGISNCVYYLMTIEAKKPAYTVKQTEYVRYIRRKTGNPLRKSKAKTQKKSARTGIYVTRRKYRNPRKWIY